MSRRERSLSACGRVREWLPELDYGGPGLWARWQAARHLRRCAECRRELEALRRGTEMLSALREDPAPAGLWERVEARMVRSAPACAAVRPPRRVPVLAAGAAAVALAAGIGLGVRSFGPDGDPVGHAAPYVHSHLALNRVSGLGASPGVDALIVFSAGGERR